MYVCTDDNALWKFWNMELEKDGEDNWTDRVKNEGLLHCVMDEKTSYIQCNIGRLIELVTSSIETSFQNMFLK